MKSAKAMTPATDMILTLLTVALLSGCAQYAVTLNEQTLYDPREDLTRVQVADPGLQACLNQQAAQRGLESALALTVLSCAGMEIRSLAGIDALGNLQILDVRENRLAHLDDVRLLRRLRSIDASGNPLNDISGLLPLSTLTAAAFEETSAIPCEQLNQLSERLGERLRRPQNCAR